MACKSASRYSRSVSIFFCASGVSGGILPSGGSTTSEVRRPVGLTDMNTALYAPATSRSVPFCWRGRSSMTARCSSNAALSSSVKNSFPAYLAAVAKASDRRRSRYPAGPVRPTGSWPPGLWPLRPLPSSRPARRQELLPASGARSRPEHRGLPDQLENSSPHLKLLLLAHQRDREASIRLSSTSMDVLESLIRRRSEALTVPRGRLVHRRPRRSAARCHLRANTRRRCRTTRGRARAWPRPPRRARFPLLPA